MRTISGVFGILAAGALAGLSCREPMRAPSVGGIALRVTPAPQGALVLDAGRVVLRGPTDTSVSAVPGSPVTIGGLQPGTYIVSLEGLTGNDVAYFGQTGNITVVAGRDTPASVDFQLFQAQAPVVPDTFWIGTQVTLGIDSVPGAGSYRVEWSLDPTFATAVNSVTTMSRPAQITVASYDRYFLRLRAVDPFLMAGVPGPAIALQIVPAGPARQMAFTAQPTMTPAGSAIAPAVTVTAQDSLGNPADYTGDVTLAITPGSGTIGTLLQGATIETAAAGAASFANVVIDSAGVGYTLTATASGLRDATSGTFDVVPRLLFLLQPRTTLARGTIPPIQVIAQDGLDHTVTGFTDDVALAISSGSGTAGATLSGVTQQPADTGVATFSDLSIDSLGTDYTLTATASGASYGGAVSDQSAPFDVTLQFVFATQPPGAGNESAMTPAVQVAARNGVGATERTFLGDVTVALVPGTGTPGAFLLGTTTVTADTGVATFPNLAVDLPGTGYRLATPGDSTAGLLGDTSAAFDIACATNCWTPVASLPVPRHLLGVGVVGGLLYAVGGQDVMGGGTDAVPAYDPMTDSWALRAPLPVLRWEHGVGVVNGTLYAVGGAGGALVDTVLAYDPTIDSWSLRAPIPTHRTGLGVGVVGGILYAVGGTDAAGNLVGTVEAFDPVAGTWSTNHQPMSVPRTGLGVAVINGMLYAVGGSDTSRTVEAYDPMNDRWSLKTPLPFPLAGGSVGAVGGQLYAVGSSGEAAMYDPQMDTWTLRPSLPVPRVGFGIGVVNGLLYVVGGADSMSDVADVEAYHP